MGEKPPLLIFNYNFAPHLGGIQTYSLNLCKQLHILGFKVIVLARNYDNAAEFDADIPFKIVRMKGVGIKPFRIPLMIFYLTKTVLRHKVRFVHCISWLPAGFIANLLSTPLRFKYITSCHGSEITQAKCFRKLLLKSTLNNSSWIISGNRYLKPKIEEIISRQTPISIIHYGVDTDVFHKNLDPDFLRSRFTAVGRQILLTVAELKPRKGIDKTIEALQLLKEKGVEPIYIIVGTGNDEKRLRLLAKKSNIENSVIFAGAVTDTDIPFYYALADLYIMPNRESTDHDIEGFGISFIEAQATGVPVIGGKSGGVEDAIVDKKTGFLVDGNNIQEIADTLHGLLTNNELKKSMGQMGIERAKTLFSWEIIINRTVMIYNKIGWANAK